MSPQQAVEVLLNIPEPRRTLTLSDAATALRVSELLALTWSDLDFRDLVMYVRRAYVWGRFKVPKSKASNWKFRLSAAKSFEMWWPGTELNRHRLLKSWKLL